MPLIIFIHGPTGTGKSYIIEQVASLLNIEENHCECYSYEDDQLDTTYNSCSYHYKLKEHRQSQYSIKKRFPSLSYNTNGKIIVIDHLHCLSIDSQNEIAKSITSSKYNGIKLIFVLSCLDPH